MFFFFLQKKKKKTGLYTEQKDEVGKIITPSLKYVFHLSYMRLRCFVCCSTHFGICFSFVHVIFGMNKQKITNYIYYNKLLPTAGRKFAVVTISCELLAEHAYAFSFLWSLYWGHMVNGDSVCIECIHLETLFHNSHTNGGEYLWFCNSLLTRMTWNCRTRGVVVK